MNSFRRSPGAGDSSSSEALVDYACNRQWQACDVRTSVPLASTYSWDYATSTSMMLSQSLPLDEPG